MTTPADLLTETGRLDLWATWIDAHAEGDDPGDLHYRNTN